MNPVELQVAKINISQRILFWYTSNEHTKEEIQKEMSYLRINLAEEVKDLYNENNQTLTKETSVTNKKGEDFYY